MSRPAAAQPAATVRRRMPADDRAGQDSADAALPPDTRHRGTGYVEPWRHHAWDATPRRYRRWR